MELLIVIAIIGILIAIAMPSYQIYTRRAHFTEIIQATAPFKLGIEECFQVNESLKDCQAGQNGVPIAITNNESQSGLLKSITISTNTRIIATPMKKYGLLATDTYTLTPSAHNNQLTWTSSGPAVSKGYAN